MRGDDEELTAGVDIGDRFRVRLITPAFTYGAGGEGGNPSPEIRVSSLRGIIRWWFRVTANGILRNLGMSSSRSLKCVSRMEAKILGSTSRASLAKLRIEGDGLKRVKASEIFGKCCEIEVSSSKQNESSRRDRRVARYCVNYLGYGIPADAMGLEGEFDLLVYFDWRSSKLERDILRTVIGVWGALGGIGRRQRRGMGSVSLIDAPKVEGVKLSSHPFDVRDVKALLEKLESLISDYSRKAGCGSLSEGRNVDNFGELHVKSFHPVIGPPYDDAVEALKELAFRFRRFREDPNDRSRCKEMSDKEGERKPIRQRTLQYLNVMRGIMWGSGGEGALSLEWSVFGLPHNYYSRGRREGGKARAFITWRSRRLSVQRGRRASPVFAKIVSVADQSYRPVVFVITSDYLPEGSELAVTVERRGNRKHEGWRKVNSYHAPVPSMKKLEDFLSYLREVWGEH